MQQHRSDTAGRLDLLLQLPPILPKFIAGGGYPVARRAGSDLMAETCRANALADEGVRWSPRATLLLSGGLSLLMWGVIVFAVATIR